MFGLSWNQIILILLAALFLLGPERIPVAVRWLMESLRKLRTMAAGAQQELRSQIGPELDELRRQVAELQSLKELGELRALRELNPRTMLGKSLLGDEFSGGIQGFLGLSAQADGAAGEAGGSTAPAAGSEAAPGAAATNGAANAANATSTPSTGGAPASASVATRTRRTLAPDEVPPIDHEGT